MKRKIVLILSVISLLSILLLNGCSDNKKVEEEKNNKSSTETQNKKDDETIEEVIISEEYDDIENDLNSNLNTETEISSKVKEAYDEATNLTIYDLDEDSLGGYSYGELSIVEEDREWIANSLNDEGTLESGALYRSMAYQLEGYTFISYDSWKGTIVPILFGFDKPDTKDELDPYIKNVSKYIVVDNSLKKIMKRLSKLSCIDGTINIKKNKYDFRINDLTEAANEMQITEEGLGYILAMIDEYGASVEFNKNSYSCKLEDHRSN